MACRARVVSGAYITKDDLYMQFFYQPQCPYCGRTIGGPGAGVAYPGSDFHENEFCSSCQKPFDILIVRDA